MGRPEKKEVYKPTNEQVGRGAYYRLAEIEGYNQACDEWEKWLPSEEEILSMVRSCTNYKNNKELAKGIHKRLRGEE